jgi:hypothetical protein
MEDGTKTFALAAVAILGLGMGVASTREALNNANDHLPSPACTHSPANG